MAVVDNHGGGMCASEGWRDDGSENNRCITNACGRGDDGGIVVDQ